MNLEQIEQSVRNFLIEDLMKDELEGVALNAELGLDSLDTTELRVFVEENFSLDPSKLIAEKLDTLEHIVGQIAEHVKG
ncbi:MULTISPECIES: acyl carrier protein [Pseudoalteromonas]|uniref:Carrier domain-containing protein n=1 Tax=Pseudoalteromonas amylolytica TaxID=1859457 RepID=A0A1S1MSN9_9GAMM|nr:MULTISPECIES: acyl carrier protein [Pseudoalteromonas]MCF6436504.1 acyl carrier protein [Pseudoalteromonas sp. MMG022]OHU86148.1 hypothetical protein BFC16_15675 [Pseudoalteromonas sp. JW3]OHU89745.1 hypothetical protein BET10_16640 [Pseudoalteromonas amylolytica]